MNGRLLTLVQPFAKIAAQYADPLSAIGECWVASDWFARYLTDYGYRPVLIQCNERYEIDKEVCNTAWRHAHPQDVHHHVARVGGLVFDWTARQFDRTAAFPHISKMIDLSREWRLVDDMAIYRRGADGQPVIKRLNA